MSRCAAVLGAVLMAACVGDFDSPAIVEDLRVLAIAAEPPEIVLDGEAPRVALAALIADPRDPERLVEFAWTACGLTDDLRCASAPHRQPLGDGSAGLDEIRTTLEITPDLQESATELDTYRGFGGVSFVVELLLEAGTDDHTHSIKQVPAPIGLPPGTTPNTNPSPPAVRRDGRDWPEDQVLEVFAGAEVSVEPVSPAEDAEAYSVFRFDLGIEDLEEHLGYDFFATAGEWSREYSGGPPDLIATETTLASVWRAPDEPGPITFWLVVRDGRGGTAWTTRRAEVVR